MRWLSHCQPIYKDTCLTRGLRWKKNSSGFQQATIIAHHNYMPSSSNGKQARPGQPTSVAVDMLLWLQVNSQAAEEALAQGK